MSAMSNRDSRRSGRLSLLILAALILVMLSLLLVAVLHGCQSGQLLSKEELAARVAEGEGQGDTVSLRLSSWGFPSFYKQKLDLVDSIFREYYVKEIPDLTTVARKTADNFLTYFYDSIALTDRQAVTEALINCFLSVAGDPYAIYRTESESEDYTSDMSGEFVGIGMTVQYRALDGSITVTAVMPDSPAQEAGICAGDLLSAVDGVSVGKLGYNGTLAAVRGEVGTAVTVTVTRAEASLSFTVVRRALVEQSVSCEIGTDGIAYLRITSFKANTAQQFREAMTQVEQAGAVGIIFDLRDNPGGYLTAIVDVLDYLVPAGTPIASFGDYAAPIYATDEHVLSLPIVVLCNGNTASAGELFTAAIRDYRDMGLLRATVVGETTYKKGVMQSTFTFTDGSTLTMTVSFYNPPSGVNYDGVGVKPDVAVPATEGADAQRAAAQAAMAELISAAALSPAA